MSQQQGTEVAGQGRRRSNRWRLEFPYHWDAYEMVARREVLRLAVIASGALFAGTALLAALSRIDDRKRGGEQAIARVDEVPPGEALYFSYPGDDDQAMLINHPISGFVAYSQKCTHLSCAVFYQKDKQRLYCPCHEGIFETTTGQPIAGPPQRRLPQIRLAVRGGVIYALEEIP